MGLRYSNITSGKTQWYALGNTISIMILGTQKDITDIFSSFSGRLSLLKFR